MTNSPKYVKVIANSTSLLFQINFWKTLGTGERKIQDSSSFSSLRLESIEFTKSLL